MYYGLSNFYQNHRRYVKSRDDSQLNGDNSSLLVGIQALILIGNEQLTCISYHRAEYGV